jgi:hypothetical protein
VDPNFFLSKIIAMKSFIYGLLVGILPVPVLFFIIHNKTQSINLKSQILANQGMAIVDCATINPENQTHREKILFGMFEDYCNMGVYDKSAAIVLFHAMRKRPDIKSHLGSNCQAWIEKMIELHHNMESMSTHE